MRSIRVSLVLYVLLLLTAALGAVFWFLYQSSAQTLRDQLTGRREHLEAQTEIRQDALKAELDQAVWHQADTVASLARFTIPHYESLYPLGVLASVLEPHGYLTSYLWLAEGMHPPLAGRLFWMGPREIRLDLAQEVAQARGDHYQIYNHRGRPLARSPALQEGEFVLEPTLLRRADFFKPYYDDVELESGAKLRRVTLKATITRFGSGGLPTLLPSPPFGGRRGPRGPGPVIYVQFARDTAALGDSLAGLQDGLNDDLTRLENESREALAGLRLRLFGVGVATFAAVLIGGFWLVRLGLAPLQRLSLAVSQVSPRDFRLPIDEAKLPHELQPIAHRLAETLEQLKRAFAREKQAAADISHELRTPLAALLTTIDVGLKKPRTLEEYREVLQDCRTSGQQMTCLVERLLALARLDAGVDMLRPHSVDVADLARQCASLVRPLAEARGLKLAVHTNGPAVLEADPDKLREILTNLLHNAIEYNRPEGSIDLSVERSNGRLRMEVRDTGIGIAPEEREHIFERFYRADPSRHSDTPHAGLGLAIVKGYVDLMGGNVDVDSSSEGSIFRVEFPARG